MKRERRRHKKDLVSNDGLSFQKIVGLKNISLSIHSLSIPDRNSFARKKKRRRKKKKEGKIKR